MTIGIIFAMQIELDAFIAHYDTVQQHDDTKLVMYSIEHKTHKIICGLSGIGKVNAAIATTTMLTKHPIDVLFNIGVAGGINVPIATIVLAEKTMYGDVNLHAFGYPLGQLPNQDLNQHSDQRLLTQTLEVIEKHQFDHHVGWIASGDQFVIDIASVEPLLTMYPKICAVDMESASIMHVANHFSIPALVIRSISDQVGTENQSLEFNQFVRIAAQKVAALLKETIEIL